MPDASQVSPLAGRSTRQKRAMWSALSSIDGFTSAQQLHQQLQHNGENIALTTVYRFLQRQADTGRLDSLVDPADGESLYRICSATSQHHHLVCRICGTTVEFRAPEIDRLAQKVAARAEFSNAQLSFEAFGLCASCR